MKKKSHEKKYVKNLSQGFQTNVMIIRVKVQLSFQ